MYHRFVEERARQLAGASRRGLRSSTADFRRLWWDKHARNPSRLGVSLWRPQPPPGYVALGAVPRVPLEVFPSGPPWNFCPKWRFERLGREECRRLFSYYA